MSNIKVAKKARRVSFALPDDVEENVSSKPSINITYDDAADFDEEIETIKNSDDSSDSESDSTGHDNRDGTSSDDDSGGDEDSSDEDSSDELPSKVPKIADPAHLNDSRANNDVLQPSSGKKDKHIRDHKLVESKKVGEIESESDHSIEHSDDGSDASGASTESSSGSESDEEQTNDQRSAEKPPAPISSFTEMRLDPRLERAINRLGWITPTPIQSAVIPAALHGRDVLVSAPTGSGKTAAYSIPIIHHICRSPAAAKGIRAVVLVPTRELVHQVTTVLKNLSKYIDGVLVAGLTNSKADSAARSKNSKGKEGIAFSRAADILVGTPASVIAAAGENTESILSGVEFVVVDEADLVLSYGYEKDTSEALSRVPVTAQSMLLSATLETERMQDFKKIILRRPLTIKITADGDLQEGNSSGASHYFARLKFHKDRYLVTYALLRLDVIAGKVLLFVNNINTAFKLKLFLDQFKIKSAVLNSELPANSRVHCVDQFNAGIFDILIATDEAEAADGNANVKGKKQNKKRKRIQKDSEFGLSRGVDFRNVAAVFNFDVPRTSEGYTHRAGRTARAGKTGTVLTLVCNHAEEEMVSSTGMKNECHIAPLAFRMDQIEAFRYRVEDALRAVTDTVVHGARLADVRREIVNSEQLKNYFDENPEDLDALQHNLTLAKNIPEHLAHIPSYLLPPALRGSVSTEAKGPRFRGKRRKRSRRVGVTSSSKKGDPLKTFTTGNSIGSARERFRTKRGIKKRKSRDPGQTMLPKRGRR